MSSLISEIKKGYNTFKVFEALLENETYINGLDAQISEKNQTIQKLNNDIDEITNEKTKLQRQLKARKEAYSQKEEELKEELNKKHNILKKKHEAEIDLLNKNKENLDRFIHKGELALKAQSKEIDAGKEELAALTDKIEKARATMREMLG